MQETKNSLYFFKLFIHSPELQGFPSISNILKTSKSKSSRVFEPNLGSIEAITDRDVLKSPRELSKTLGLEGIVKSNLLIPNCIISIVGVI